MSIRNSSLLFVGPLALLGSTSARADWITICPGPTTGRFSADYGGSVIANTKFQAWLGASGTVGYQGVTSTNPVGCLPGSGGTANARGRIGFAIGSEGSIQTNFDDLMSLTYGWGHGANGVIGRMGYAIVTHGTTSSLFGTNGFQTFFSGLSDTYTYARTTNNDIQIDLRIDIVGDAARLQWDFTNQSANTTPVGLRFGQYVSLLQESTGNHVGTTDTISPSSGFTFVTVPGIQPPQTERRWSRTADPSGFPAYVNFGFSQQNAYGLQVVNSPNEATIDPTSPQDSQTQVDGFVYGNGFFLLGAKLGGDTNSFPDFIFNEPISDVRANDDTAYIQTWNPETLAPGSTRRIVSYYRTTWGDSLYSRPYSVVADTPKVINLDPNNPLQFLNNPFTIGVTVDNVRGFATIDQEISLQNVKVELLLPDGLTAVGPTVRTINSIAPKAQGTALFTVQADNGVSGDLIYQVRVTPTPGPVKTITGVIKATSQPRMIVRANANLISSPWNYTSPVWETIFANATDPTQSLLPDRDYQAFEYDPILKSYIVSTGPSRGRGQWIISKVERNIALGGTPTAPTDYLTAGAAPLAILQPGWNLIGNPYQKAIQLGQIVGASNSNPSRAFTYASLVQQGIINGSLAFWDQAKQNYDFIQAPTDRLEPQRGYWIFVSSSQGVQLRFPAVSEPFTRSQDTTKPWQQSDRQWRLQLVARGQQASDEQNFIGVASSSTEAESNKVYEPPMAPLDSAVSLAVEQTVNGQATRMAQYLSDRSGKQEFNVKVQTRQKGPVTVTWPNLSTIPKGVRVRIKDVATGEQRDLRKVSGYTFQADAAATREFVVSIENGAVTRTVIGNVVVSRTGRAGGADSSVRLMYSLGSNATTSVRILSGSNREVAVLSRGRADQAGQNEVTWNLRDSANRAVPPGTYRAEIIAEGDDGERVRKIHPILVTR
jgi:hypothetical protein